jgi:SAM-dependent methyltransferase
LAPAPSHLASTLYFRDKYLSYIEKECAGAKSLLDVGCGTGALLELLHESMPALHRVGIELNADRAEYARGVAKCAIYQVPIEQFSPENRFDVVTMINVLSHIPSFDDLFASIHNVVAADGKLILKVGEMAADIDKNAVFDWGIPDHLHFLGMNTIQYIAAKYGFRVVRHERQPLSVDLFSRSRWIAPGRSTIRNMVKRAVASAPCALSIGRRLYDMRHRDKIWSSFVVLSPQKTYQESG